MQNPYRDYISDASISVIAGATGLPLPDAYSQDWEYEVADSAILERVFDLYKNRQWTDEEKFTLMTLMIGAFDDALWTDPVWAEGFWPDMEGWFCCDAELLAYILFYWALWETEDLDDAFPITPRMRELCRKLGLQSG